jgi:hypothetical protein
VRIHAVLHVKSRLEAGATVPIGWVAVGNPARIFSPNQQDEIWAVQKPLNLPLKVYGDDREEADMQKITGRLAQALGSHREDSIVK